MGGALPRAPLGGMISFAPVSVSSLRSLTAMPLRGTLSGVAPVPRVSRRVLPDAPRLRLRTSGAENGGIVFF